MFLTDSLLRLVAQGKDSIRYLQEHEVMPEVYDAVGKFAAGASTSWCRRPHRSCVTRLPTLAPEHSPDVAGKKADDDLFDLIDPTKVNKHLQQLMPGLTIKVFRTYNASITLSRLLKETDSSLEVPGKKAQARLKGLVCRALLVRHSLHRAMHCSTTKRTRKSPSFATIRRA